MHILNPLTNLCNRDGEVKDDSLLAAHFLSALFLFLFSSASFLYMMGVGREGGSCFSCMCFLKFACHITAGYLCLTYFNKIHSSDKEQSDTKVIHIIYGTIATPGGKRGMCVCVCV